MGTCTAVTAVTVTLRIMMMATTATALVHRSACTSVAVGATPTMADFVIAEHHWAGVNAGPIVLADELRRLSF